jgi:hypothetical protein
MAVRSSYFLAVLLIANPFMLLVFQNCSSNSHERTVASADRLTDKPNFEYFENIDSKLEIR